MQELGKRIIELCAQKGWSQSDLVRACGKDRQAMEILENGKVNHIVRGIQSLGAIQVGRFLKSLMRWPFSSGDGGTRTYLWNPQ